MTRLSWGDDAARLYDVGVDRGVLYPPDGSGVAWQGLISIQDAPVNVDEAVQHYDGAKYRRSGKPGEFAATLEAYSYPKEFGPYDGFSGILSQQYRKSFGLSYRTRSGERDYKIHLVYNALASPSALDHESISDSTEAATFSWGISTTPVMLPGISPTAHLIIDTAIAYPSAVQDFEEILYGNDEFDPRLPSAQEVLDFFEARSTLLIVDHGDGSWSAIGPDSMILMFDATTFVINTPSATYLDDDTYTISSI